MSLAPQANVSYMLTITNPQLVALEKIFEGVTILYNGFLTFDMVKVMVEKVYNVNVAILMPTFEMTIVTQTFETFVV